MSFYEMARMAAETVVIREYGPEARIDAFTLDGVETDRALFLTKEDGVHVITPGEAVTLSATVRVWNPVDRIDIKITPISLPGQG